MVFLEINLVDVTVYYITLHAVHGYLWLPATGVIGACMYLIYQVSISVQKADPV